MEFDSYHKVILESLSEEEAAVFIHFLKRERERHELEVEETDWLINTLKGSDSIYIEILIKFYASAIARHKDDIESIDKLIEKVKARYE